MANKKLELEKIVGAKHVVDNPKTLKAYSEDCSFVASRKPELLVKPANVDEVQRVVRWANETSTPLVPLSSGEPHFRGDTIPAVDKAIIVDLGLMNRIIKIHRRNRYVIFEPGVTWGQLQLELAKEGMYLPMPLLPRKTKSVLASLLEREPTLTPHHHWTLLDPLRCLEIIWGNGDKLLTGEAGWSQGSLEEQWERHSDQVYGSGPGQVDYYRFMSGAQGTIGIATWGSARCELLPKAKKLFFTSSENLGALLDFTYRRFRLRFGDELLLLNRWNLASLIGENANTICAINTKLPAWVLIHTIAGYDRLPEERVKFQEVDIINLAKEFGVQLTQSIPGLEAEKVEKLLREPSKEPYWKIKNKGACQEIFFLTTLDKTPEFIKIIYSAAENAGYPTSEIGIYIQPQMQGGCCHCEFDLFYDPGNAGDKSKVKELFSKASEEIESCGGYFSRPYDIWKNTTYDKDNENTRVAQKIKKLFDPNNVMNPNKLCY